MEELQSKVQWLQGELDKERAKGVAAEATHQNLLQQAENQQQKLTEAITALQRQHEGTQGELKSTTEQLNDRSEQLAEARRTQTSLRERLASTESSVRALEADKVSLDHRLDSKQKALELQQKEYDELVSQVHALTQSELKARSDHNTALMEANSARNEAQMRRKEAERLQQELNDAEERHRRFSEEKKNAIQELQNDRFELQNQIKLARTELSKAEEDKVAAESRATASEERARESTTELRRREAVMEERVQSYAAEYAALEAVNGRLKEELQAQRRRSDDLEPALEQVRLEFSRLREETDRQVAEAHKQRDEALQAAKDADDQTRGIMKSAGVQLPADSRPALEGAGSEELRLVEMGGAAGASQENVLTAYQVQEQRDFYKNQVDTMEWNMRKQALEFDHVNELLQSRLADMQTQQAEYEQMRRSFNTMSARLATAHEERNSLQQDLARLRMQAGAAERDTQLAQSRANDIARQIAGLLAEIARLKGHPQPQRGPVPYPDNLDARMQRPGSDVQGAQASITEVFGDVQDLDGVMAQNDRLRRALREVAQKAERDREDIRAEVTSTLEPQLQAKTKEIERLEAVLEEKDDMIGKLEATNSSLLAALRTGNASAENTGAASNSARGLIVREVDESATIRDLRASFQQDAQQLRADFEAARVKLEQEISRAERDKADASKEAAVARAELQHQRDRVSDLLHDLQASQKQVEDGQKRALETQDSMFDAHRQFVQASENVEALREQLSEKDRKLYHEQGLRAAAEDQCARMEREARDAMKNKHDAEARLRAYEENKAERDKRQEEELNSLRKSLKENGDALMKERQKLAEVKKELQQTRDLYHSEDRTESINRLREEVKRLKQEVEEKHSELSSAQDKNRAGEAVKEQLQQDLKETQEEVYTLRARIERLGDADNVTAEAADASGPSATAAAAAGDASTGGGADEGRSSGLLRSQLRAVHEELRYYQKQTTSLQATQRQYAAIAKASDDTNAELRQSQKELEAKIAGVEEEANQRQAAAEQRINELNVRVQTARAEAQSSERAKLDALHERDTARGQLSVLEQQKKELEEARDREGDEYRQHVTSLQEAMKKEQERHDSMTMQQSDYVRRLREAQQQLEHRDATLARTSTELATARREVREAREELSAAKRDALAQKDRLQEEVARLRESLEGQIRDAEAPRTDGGAASSGDGGNQFEAMRRILEVRKAELSTLQAEKNLADAKNSKLESERNNFREHAASLQGRVKGLEDELSKRAGALVPEEEHRTRMTHIESLALLRNANEALQQRERHFIDRTNELSKEVKRLRDEISRAERDNNILQGKLEREAKSREGHERMAEDWKKQAALYISKYGTVDEATHREVLAARDAARAENDQLQQAKAELEERLATADKKVAASDKKVAEVQKELEECKRKLQQANKASTSRPRAQTTSEEVPLLRQRMNELQAERGELMEEVQELKATVDRKERTNRIQTNAFTLLGRKSVPGPSGKPVPQNAEAFARELKEEIDRLRSNQSEAAAPSSEEMEALQKQVSDLEAANAEVQKQLAAAQQQMASSEVEHAATVQKLEKKVADHAQQSTQLANVAKVRAANLKAVIQMLLRRLVATVSEPLPTDIDQAREHLGLTADLGSKAAEALAKELEQLVAPQDTEEAPRQARKPAAAKASTSAVPRKRVAPDTPAEADGQPAPAVPSTAKRSRQVEEPAEKQPAEQAAPAAAVGVGPGLTAEGATATPAAPAAAAEAAPAAAPKPGPGTPAAAEAPGAAADEEDDEEMEEEDDKLPEDKGEEDAEEEEELEEEAGAAEMEAAAEPAARTLPESKPDAPALPSTSGAAAEGAAQAPDAAAAAAAEGESDVEEEEADDDHEDADDGAGGGDGDEEELEEEAAEEEVEEEVGEEASDAEPSADIASKEAGAAPQHEAAEEEGEEMQLEEGEEEVEEEAEEEVEEEEEEETHAEAPADDKSKAGAEKAKAQTTPADPAIPPGYEIKGAAAAEAQPPESKPKRRAKARIEFDEEKLAKAAAKQTASQLEKAEKRRQSMGTAGAAPGAPLRTDTGPSSKPEEGAVKPPPRGRGSKKR